MNLILKGQQACMVLYWSIFNGGNMVCSLTCHYGGDNLNTFPNRYFIYTMIGDREEKVFAHAKKRSHSLDHFIWCSCLVFQHPCILLCDICMQLSAHVKLSFYAQDTSCLHEFHSLMNHYMYLHWSVYVDVSCLINCETCSLVRADDACSYWWYMKSSVDVKFVVNIF